MGFLYDSSPYLHLSNYTSRPWTPYEWTPYVAQIAQLYILFISLLNLYKDLFYGVWYFWKKKCGVFCEISKGSEVLMIILHSLLFSGQEYSKTTDSVGYFWGILHTYYGVNLPQYLKYREIMRFQWYSPKRKAI